jgi:hypothetical protein
VKSHNTANKSATTKTLNTDLESVEFDNFLTCVWLNLKTFKFYLIKMPQISNDNQAIYHMKEPHFKKSGQLI